MHVTPGGARISRTAAMDLGGSGGWRRRGRAVISLGFLFRALRVTGTPKPAQIFDTDFLLQGHLIGSVVDTPN